MVPGGCTSSKSADPLVGYDDDGAASPLQEKYYESGGGTSTYKVLHSVMVPKGKERCD